MGKECKLNLEWIPEEYLDRHKEISQGEKKVIGSGIGIHSLTRVTGKKPLVKEYIKLKFRRL